MELKMSQKIRRIGVIFIIVCLVNIVAIYEYATDNTMNLMLGASIILNLIFFIALFYTFFIKTKIWKFAHTPFQELDEREILLTGNTLRKAYAIFSIIVLVILFTLTLLERQTSMVLVSALIILAHIIPVAIIAWTEKQVSTE